MNDIYKYLRFILISTVIFACNKEQSDFQLSLEFDKIVNKYENLNDWKCIVVNDIINYPNPWTKEISDTFEITKEKLETTSTCGLIQTFYKQPWNVLGPWSTTSSNLTINGIQYFNDRIKTDPIIIELMSRADAPDKIAGTYIGYIYDLDSLSEHPGRLYSYEILLSSDKINAIITEDIGEELVILSLKMIEAKKEVSEFNSLSSIAITRHIIANALIQCKFEPFLTDCLINGSLETTMNGYSICYIDEKIENYAKQYLKDLNPN